MTKHLKEVSFNVNSQSNKFYNSSMKVWLENNNNNNNKKKK